MDHDPKGRTFAEAIAENLVRIGCSQGPSAVHAANKIANRVDVVDFTADLRSRSDEELRFHLEDGRWPTTQELVLLSQPVKPTEM